MQIQVGIPVSSGVCLGGEAIPHSVGVPAVRTGLLGSDCPLPLGSGLVGGLFGPDLLPA